MTISRVRTSRRGSQGRAGVQANRSGNQPLAACLLGQLNYYEGPDDGIMGPQTIQAITYLQRDAGLPQTGQMNAATQAALAHFLAHGNNQMAG